MGFAALLDHDVEVYAPVEGAGSFDEDAVGVPVATERMAVQRADATLKDSGAGEVEQGSHRVFGLTSTAAQPRYLLKVVSGPESPVTLRVLSVTKPRGHHAEIMADVHEGAVP